MANATRQVELTYRVADDDERWLLEENEVPESPLHDAIILLLVEILLAWKTRAARDARIGRNIALRWKPTSPRHGVDPDVYLVEPHRCPRATPRPASVPRSQATFLRASPSSRGTAPLSPCRRPCLTSTIIGPAFIGYADAETFEPSDEGVARPLVAGDDAAFTDLRTSCATLEWEHGGPKTESTTRIGVFDNGVLVTLASYEVWAPRIAHISIISRPEFRGRGLGGVAVSAIARHAIGKGLVAQYRTLMSNEPSMAIARRLGFQRYAVSVAIRLATTTLVTSSAGCATVGARLGRRRRARLRGPTRRFS